MAETTNKLQSYLLHKLRKRLKDGKHSDITIIIQGREFKCHKLVLMTNDYFRAMLRFETAQGRSDTITLQDVSAEVFRSLLIFLYTGDLVVPQSSLSQLIQNAQFYLFTNLLPILLRHPQTPSSCLVALSIAATEEDEEAYDVIRQYVCDNFEEVSHTTEFLNQNIECLVDLLSDPKIKVHREKEVYEAAVRWLDYDAPARKSHSTTALETVRYPFLQRSNLRILKKCKYISQNSELLELVNIALRPI